MVELASSQFKILVGIDGSDEALRGLSYASKLGLGVRANIDLLFVRPIDQGLRSGGLQVRVVRENLLEAGVDLPGMTFLKTGRDLLAKLGHLSNEWEESFTHNNLQGDPLGNHTIHFKSQRGRSINLNVRANNSTVSGILDLQEERKHDLIIIGASGRRRAMTKFLGISNIALKVAVHAPCTVIIARDLEVGKGHLVCLDGSKKSLEALKKDAALANNCQCPISLIAVARDEDDLQIAKQSIQNGIELLGAMGIEVEQTLTPIGDPVHEIVEAGKTFSLIALADSSSTGMQRYFMGGIAFNVLEHAKNSVMIIR